MKSAQHIILHENQNTKLCNTNMLGTEKLSKRYKENWKDKI